MSRLPNLFGADQTQLIARLCASVIVVQQPDGAMRTMDHLQSPQVWQPSAAQALYEAGAQWARKYPWTAKYGAVQCCSLSLAEFYIAFVALWNKGGIGGGRF